MTSQPSPYGSPSPNTSPSKVQKSPGQKEEDNPSMAFSTFSKKTTITKDALNASPGQQHLNNVIDRFLTSRRETSSPMLNNTSVQLSVDSESQKTQNADDLRKKITFTEGDNLNFKLQKKGTKTGRTVVRDWNINPEDFRHLNQTNNNKKAKVYNVPLSFIAETKAEYLEKASKATTKAEKTKIKPWNTNSVVNKEYRIIFSRKQKLGKDQNQDTYLYFSDKEEYEKMRNYLKAITLLETNQLEGTKPNDVLFRFSLEFRCQIIMLIRRAIHEKARSILRGRMVARNFFLSEINRNLFSTFTRNWRDEVLSRRDKTYKDYSEKRNTQMLTSVRHSALLREFNDKLIKRMISTWATESKYQQQIPPEDISILFHVLEANSDIIHPKVNVDIQLRSQFSGDIDINGRRYIDKSIFYHLGCKLDHAKSHKEEATAYWWRIVAERGPRNNALDQSGIRDQSVSMANSNEENFALNFNSFPLDFLDAVEIQIKLYEEVGILKAYYNTTLKNLWMSGQRGKDVWLCMSAKNGDQGKAPLLHLKVSSKNTAKSSALLQTSFIKGEPQAYNTEYLEDTFYFYGFNLPLITPKNYKALKLLPESWKIIDNDAKSLLASGNAGKSIQHVRHNLVKHYYENATRQLARLSKNAPLWSDLQESIVSTNASSSNNQNQLFMTQGHLSKLVELSILGRESEQKTILGPNDSLGSILYLFKRDMWEHKPEWANFYNTLRQLCRKGLPPQSRFSIWSELGRTAYFITLTEQYYYQNVCLVYDDIHQKSQKIYESLRRSAETEHNYRYQEIEDDLEIMKKQLEMKKIPYAKNIRSVCRTFIFWTKLFNDYMANKKLKYHVAYSKSIMTLCYGLLVCQTGCHTESEPNIEEDQIFWLLLSLSSYIVSNYYEHSEDSVNVDTFTFKQDTETYRKKNKVIKSALNCSKIRGIKSDLLLLKLLLKKYEPKIHDKFQELGVPLDYYFAEHMLTLFINLFNPGLTYRIWDVLFFEGSSLKVKDNRMIVCFVFVLLAECREQISIAKKPSDIKFIIEIFARFATNYGTLIKKAYYVCDNCLEQKIPQTDSIMGKLELIKYALFSNEYNQLDLKIFDIEKRFEEYYSNISTQNQVISGLAHDLFDYKSSNRHRPLSYSNLTRIIKDFVSLYETQKKMELANLQTESFKDSRMISSPGDKSATISNQARHSQNSLHIRIHRAIIDSLNFEDLAIFIVFGHEERSVNLSSFNVDFEASFALTDHSQVVDFSVYDIRNPDFPRKIKSAQIDLAIIPANNFLKFMVNLNDESPDGLARNNFISEIELTLCLKYLPTRQLNIKEQGHQLSNASNGVHIVSELQNDNFDNFKSIYFPKSTASEIFDRDYLGGSKSSSKNTSPLQNNQNWLEMFNLTFNEFLGSIRKVAPWLETNPEFTKAMDFFTRPRKDEPSNTMFCGLDFFVLLILFSKITLKQKLELIFDLISAFEISFKKPEDNSVQFSALRGISKYLYRIFMIYIPHNETENMAELELFDDLPLIKKVVLNGRFETKIQGSKLLFNNFANWMQQYYDSKEIHLYDPKFLQLLKETFEKELGGSVLQNLLTNQNVIEITYITNGLNHKQKLEIDSNWRVTGISQAALSSSTQYQKIPSSYRNVLGLNHVLPTVNKSEFIRALQNLPLINYLCSLENHECPRVLSKLIYINFKVDIEDKTVYEFISAPESSKEILERLQIKQNNPTKKKKFNEVLSVWNVSASKINQKFNANSYVMARNMYYSPILRSVLASRKLDIYSSYEKLSREIRKAIIKEVSTELKQKPQNVDNFHPYIFSNNFWDYNFNVSLIVNKSNMIEIDNHSTSPFESLTNYFRDHLEEIRSIQFVFSFKNNIYHYPMEGGAETFNQLGLYCYADGSKTWLPCRIESKLQYLGPKNSGRNPISNEIDGYGVVFAKAPADLIFKKPSEVIISDSHEIEGIEITRIEPYSQAMAAGDQSALHRSRVASALTYQGERDFNSPSVEHKSIYYHTDRY